MADWTISSNKYLVDLADFYLQEAANPSSFDDEMFVANVKQAFWATNCWSFVEAAFAIIAPACSRRFHLTRLLIRSPIEAMIAGGLEDSSHVIAIGVSYANKPNQYVEPTEEGRKWLLSVWPTLDSLAQEVFLEILKEIDEELERD
jgi:hypothetical protein